MEHTGTCMEDDSNHIPQRKISHHRAHQSQRYVDRSQSTVRCRIGISSAVLTEVCSSYNSTVSLTAESPRLGARASKSLRPGMLSSRRDSLASTFPGLIKGWSRDERARLLLLLLLSLSLSLSLT